MTTHVYNKLNQAIKFQCFEMNHKVPVTLRIRTEYLRKVVQSPEEWQVQFQTVLRKQRMLIHNSQFRIALVRAFLHSWCQILYSSNDGVGVLYIYIYIYIYIHIDRQIQIFVVFVAFVSGSVFHGTKVENECTNLGRAANFV